eukprot:Cvel_27738.t1-p1 / transcript=Cvel_27738.t1 / gene=Cvel_27738 / organism=Chromera_velia_CCMP2878 / gene_product=DNA damage-inducible protein 1, putative / transcript_product=DNA damage-inducible protein 1, putative / location=Cvel_scaffold3512:11743-15605(+) / protein_length=186 / sequence_SO=supercontig / SO=protein_coding / is_pseudo=false
MPLKFSLYHELSGKVATAELSSKCTVEELKLVVAAELLQQTLAMPGSSSRRNSDAVRRQRIDKNYEEALELNPEAFARVVMLYIDTKVNGVPFKAFVDTGAQMTIISRAAAKRAGLESLIDERFQGRAVGVGEAPIVGRIHMTEMEVGDSTLLCSFTVLGGESDIDIILGLDMLMKHECSVNLKDK